MKNCTIRNYLLLLTIITLFCSCSLIQIGQLREDIDSIKLIPAEGYILGNTPYETISLDSMNFYDENIRISINQIKGLFYVQLINLTEGAIYIDWDLGSFIDFAGSNWRIVHGETRVMHSRSAQPLSVLAPQSNINLFLVPLNGIQHILNLKIPIRPTLSNLDSREIKNIQIKRYNAKVELYNLKLKQSAGSIVTLLIPINIRDQNKKYMFRMYVEYVKYIPKTVKESKKNVEKKNKRSRRERNRRK